MKDSRTLHFLKHFPAWIVLSILLLIMTWRYELNHDQFFQRVLDTILGALLGILVGRPSPSSTTTTTDLQANLNNVSDDEIASAVSIIEEEKR